MEEKIKYISIENLNLYHTLLKDYIAVEDAKALKTVALSKDNTKLLFYTVSEPVGETAPAFEITLPSTDLTGVMKKVVNAIDGNIGTFKNGEMSDSGIAISDLADKAYVDGKIKEEVGKSQHLKKEIVSAPPSVEYAKEDVIYLVKDADAKGDDKYNEYMLIGGEVVKIGSTSIDLSNYDTKEQVDAKIAQAKTDAIKDATDAAAEATQQAADKALGDAKAYTDTKVGDLEKKVTANTTTIGEVQQTVTNLSSTVTQHGDRISKIEESIGDLSTATEEDIRALFA